MSNLPKLSPKCDLLAKLRDQTKYIPQLFKPDKNIHLDVPAQCGKFCCRTP